MCGTHKSGNTLRAAKSLCPHYKGELIGAYIADIVVDNAVILELKSVDALNKVMEAQIINYLKLSKVPVGYLINFNGLRVEWRRFVHQRE